MGDAGVPREPGWSIRLKLTLSYAGFLMVASVLLLAAVWVFLLRYVPEVIVTSPSDGSPGPSMFVPNRSDLLDAFVPKVVLALIALLVFGLVGGWFLAGRMLAPLDRITSVTRRVAGGSLGQRIHLEGRNDEFREFADAFDAMLERLDAHVAEQQRFAANASHELRTPLAITQTLLDVARQDPGQDPGVLVDRLYSVNSRAIDLTEALLLLSRAGQGVVDRETVDLSLIAEEAAESLLPLAEACHVEIETTGDVTVALGSHALLLQMTTNLVHNAIVHNVADHGEVRVDVRSEPGAAVLVVENTGEVLSPQVMATLTEPFQRGTERVRSDHAGVGLGLAIVERIGAAHDGTLTLSPRTGGGLVAVVRLPAP